MNIFDLHFSKKNFYLTECLDIKLTNYMLKKIAKRPLALPEAFWLPSNLQIQIGTK